MALLASKPRSRHLMALALGLALFQAGSVAASSLSVSPTLVTLTPRVSSAILELRNESDLEVRVEVTLRAWAQTSSGNSELTATDDLVAFPALSAIRPHGTRSLRIGLLNREAAHQERSYRILIEEMPPSASEVVPGQVVVRTRLSIPIFVAPPIATATLQLDEMLAREGEVVFRLANPGNSHLRLESVSVSAEGSNGEMLASHTLRAWYLLGGGERRYRLPLDPEECTAAESYLIEARGGSESVSGRIAVAPELCATPQ